MIMLSESFILEKSSVPLTVIDEFSGIVFVRSNDSPIAFSLVLLMRVISSRELEAARNAIAEPTLPLPMIEIKPKYL